jgi:O-antigen/teichoic acid export membrane protein
MTSHRDILRSSAMIGGSSFINMLVGMLRVKALAVLLGPTGIGLMGLYQNIMNMGALLASCGVETSGVRQIATSSSQVELLATVRRAMLIGSTILGTAGMIILWLLRDTISTLVFGDTVHASSVSWLGVGVLLTVIAGAHTALLQGLRRVDDLVKISIFTAAGAAIAGVSAVFFLGEDGVLWFVIATPLANLILTRYYAAQLPRTYTEYELATVKRTWVALLKFGIPLMTAGLMTLITQLIVRSIVLRDLGLEASGLFHAAWTISMTYVAFALSAMAMDYFPRLSSAIDDRSKARTIINEQAEMALLLTGPLLIAVLTVAPWMIHLLYSEEFKSAADILKWQVLGDILKVSIAPCVYIFLANGKGGVAIGIQTVWCAAYLGIVALGINDYGLAITGISFLLAYIIYSIVVVILAFKLIGYLPSRRISLITLFIFIIGATIVFVAAQSQTAGLFFGIISTAVLGGYSLRRLDRLTDLKKWLQQRLG